MHELSIAMSVLELAEEEADRRGGVGVRTIYLKLGALSGVDKQALLSAYELAVEQTQFADCQLIIEDIPTTVYCSKCEAERTIPSIQLFECPECGTPASDVVRGRELQVSALELSE